jgi:predicted RNA-binding protein
LFEDYIGNQNEVRGRWKKFDNEELYVVYSSINIKLFGGKVMDDVPRGLCNTHKHNEEFKF